MFLLLVLPLITAAQDPVKVYFRLVANGLPEGKSVFITGGNPLLGNWNPGAVKMNYIGRSTWEKAITTSSAQSIEYKYTLGSWNEQGATKEGAPLQNSVVKINGAKQVNDTISYWTSGETKRAVVGQVTGNVKYHKGLKWEGLKDRDVVVWLPPGYDSDKAKSYPVLYMHDGQNIFDPSTSAFGTDWSIDEAADSLIRNDIIPGIIIVGIYNTADRMKEYMPGPMSAAYTELIIQQIKPLIDRTYRTKTDSRNTFVGGSSAGGIMSFMLVYEHPEVFSKAICMSPAFKIDQWDYVRNVLAGGKKKQKQFFYIDNGGLGLEGQLQPGIDDMLAALKQQGYKEWQEYVFIAEPEARHAEADWAKRFPNALHMLFLAN